MAVLALVYSFFDSVAMPIAMKTKKKMSIKEMWQFPVLESVLILFVINLSMDKRSPWSLGHAHFNTH